MNIYVANLDNGIDNEKLADLFSSYGQVQSAEIATDVFTGMSRGFGYVEMDDDTARVAINELNQTVLHTLIITVEEAPPKKVQQGSYKIGTGEVNPYRFKKN